jgi:Adenylate and Guanylate cyclase catalytic domain
LSVSPLVRDPSQVFKLLEAVYSAFDAVARRRGVFKVETIGDSYVCVTYVIKSHHFGILILWTGLQAFVFPPGDLLTHRVSSCAYFGVVVIVWTRPPKSGLPDPQRDHALIMARFARDCRIKFKEVTRKLELSLGPDTGDLCMRYVRARAEKVWCFSTRRLVL